MPERICKNALEYPPGKLRAIGEPFEVEEQHLRVLTDTGFIEPNIGAAKKLVEHTADEPATEEAIEIEHTDEALKDSGSQNSTRTRRSLSKGVR